LRLGTRLDEHTLERAMLKIREAHEVNPHRAHAIVHEHADAL
jgi:hypothetical protein